MWRRGAQLPRVPRHIVTVEQASAPSWVCVACYSSCAADRWLLCDSHVHLPTTTLPRLLLRQIVQKGSGPRAIRRECGGGRGRFDHTDIVVPHDLVRGGITRINGRD